MKKTKYSFLFLLFASAIWMSWEVTMISTKGTTTCEIVIGEDVEIELGEEVEFNVNAFCSTPNEIVDIVWSPTDYLTCVFDDCLDILVEPLSSICYTVTINWLDGEVSTDSVCVFLKTCEETYDDSNIVSISPNPIDDEAIIELEISRTQYAYFEIVDDQEVLYTIKEGWIGEGLQNINLDFSTVPSGNYELRARLYPEYRYIDIIIN